MTTSNQLVATTPLLTVDQVAGELCILPLAVRRLIAIGVLKASRLGDAGEWKVLPDDLRKYVTSGTPHIKMPELEGEWFKDNPLYSAANQFEQQARGILVPFLPESAPDEAHQRGSLDLSPADAAKQVRDAAALPPHKHWVRMPGDSPSLFSSRGEEYLAGRIRVELHWLLERPMAEAVRHSLGGVAKINLLYDNPEEFQKLTAKAWGNLMLRQFLASKIYPAKDQFSQTPRVTIVAKVKDVFPAANMKAIVDRAL